MEMSDKEFSEDSILELMEEILNDYKMIHHPSVKEHKQMFKTLIKLNNFWLINQKYGRPKTLLDKYNADYVSILTNGNDNLKINNLTPKRFLVYGYDGDDIIIGDFADDTIFGKNGNDWLRGSLGNDSIFQGSGNDFIIGGFGNDSLEGGKDDDHIEGGEGADFDTLNYQSFYDTEGVYINLATSEAKGGHVQEDKFISIEAIHGSRFNNTLIGDYKNNTLRGEKGDDFLEGREGNDYLLGGQGADIFNYQLDMENGKDTIGDFNIYEDKIKITSNSSLTFLEIKSDITSNTEDDAGINLGTWSVTLIGVGPEELNESNFLIS